MICGSTASGFAFSVDEEALNDMEILDALERMESGDMLKIPKICRLLLGDAQQKRLYDHCRKENGRVPIDAVSNELTEIIRAGGKQGKN